MAGHPHDECETCETQDRNRAERGISPVAFADADAWGFDEVCATLTAVDPATGLILDHQYLGKTVPCPTVGRLPKVQPGPEVEPVRLVSLRKSAQHLRLRKERYDRRARARAKVMAMTITPTSVEVNGADITHMIIGPVQITEE